ncbi:hypothetical protein [Falsiroseomonas sp. CW058]|uniref:hypothetical protein n=1 Tax=Falsiroseomonas sp. CW058 TaxID=3388664 RepID=UPI003D3121F4
MRKALGLAVAAAILGGAAVSVDAQSPPGAADMTFFVTSTGLGRGADLGGLAGADAHCQALAQAAGAGGRTWRAYLSTQGQGAVNARDRIGTGPWRNANGTVIARSVADLHSEANAMTKETNVDERGQVVRGRGDNPNEHDILTGSNEDGTAIAGSEDRTCRNWTYSGPDGSAMVGHHDRIGLRDDAPSRSWNTSHPSRGCSQDALRSSGGAGLFYCFAIN